MMDPERIKHLREYASQLGKVPSLKVEELLELLKTLDEFTAFREEAREIFQQSHNDEEVDTGDAINFIGRVAGTEEGWKAE